MILLKIVFLFIIKFNLIVESAKILAVFSCPFLSHQKIYRPLTQELARRGHEVVVITTDPAFPKGEAPTNLTEIDVHDISYPLLEKHVLRLSKTGASRKSISKYTYNLTTEVFERLIENNVFPKIVNDEQQLFDLLIIEAFVKAATSLTHIYKTIPVIQVSPFGSFDTKNDFGVPTHPVLYPTFTHQKLYNLTFWEKVSEVYNHLIYTKIFSDNRQLVNVALHRIFGPDIPSVEELSNNLDILLLNVQLLWEDNVPVPPSVLFVGGISEKLEDKLPEDLISFMDASSNGVIYISFGSKIKPSLLHPEKMQILLKVLSQLPYDILLKWDTDELHVQSKNIRISKWWPQSDLLRHPKTKLFITHGGLLSTNEAINAGVPVIGIPLLADQWYNTEKYVYYNIGLKLNMETLTEELVQNAINTIIKNESYRSNVVRLHAKMNDQPHSSLHHAAWAAERALRFGRRGAALLRSPAANMTLARYFELELALIVSLASLLILFVAFLIMKFICKKILVRRINILNS